MDGLLLKVKYEIRGLVLFREIVRDIIEENLVGYNKCDILVV